MRKGVEQEVVVGRPFYLLWAGFVVALVLELVYAQGVLGQTQGIAVTSLLIGIVGLFGGYIVNFAYLRRGDYVTTRDTEQVLTYGVGGFIVMTLVNSLMKGFSDYQATISQTGLIVTLAAAPFEEVFFRLLMAAAVYRGLLFVVPQLRHSITRLFGMSSYRTGPSEMDRWIAMVLTGLFLGWVFVQFHAAVANILAPSVAAFYFTNSFVYTIIFLYTRNIMVSTTTHLLHNGAMLFFVLF